MGTHTERGLIKMTSDRAMEVWYPQRRPEHSCGERFDLHDFAVDTLGAGCDVRYLEFGVQYGRTISRFASKFVNPQAEFYGFDSFWGLPEDWAGTAAGAFSLQGAVPKLGDKRIELVPGWFQNTVPVFVSRLQCMPGKVTLVNFDADLYSSTLFLLASLWPVLPQYYFMFDEFVGEELAALRNFLHAFPAEVELFSRVDSAIGEPVQVFGRMKRVPMVVTDAA